MKSFIRFSRCSAKSKIGEMDTQIYIRIFMHAPTKQN